jgi:hypothetical protein
MEVVVFLVQLRSNQVCFSKSEIRFVLFFLSIQIPMIPSSQILGCFRQGTARLLKKLTFNYSEISDRRYVVCYGLVSDVQPENIMNIYHDSEKLGHSIVFLKVGHSIVQGTYYSCRRAAHASLMTICFWDNSFYAIAIFCGLLFTTAILLIPYMPLR